MKDKRAFEQARDAFRKKTRHLDEEQLVRETNLLVEEVRSQPPSTLHLLGVTFTTSSNAPWSESSTLSFC